MVTLNWNQNDAGQITTEKWISNKNTDLKKNVADLDLLVQRAFSLLKSIPQHAMHPL